MAGDYTQHQTLGEQLEAERLSLQATLPPSEVPGFRLERFLGAGAFGQVWVGRDLNTGRPVAIKFYLHRGGVNWSLLSREVKNLVQLSADRYVVQVLEVGWEADPPYYVMEYLPSGSLEDLLHARGRLPVRQAVDMFRKIAIGLNHSHGKGVLHCDLKPANILLDQDYEPRLADFGQSRMSHEQTPALGTLFYMAPEQADLEAAPDACWDVYALGAILYRMLTGNAPHRSDRLVNQLDTSGSLPIRLKRYRDAILHDPKPTAHQSRRGVDRQLAQIVDRCLAADPQHRFQNVQQILEALDRREAKRARQPLMLLGIVGPLLLLTASSVFLARSISQARTVSTEVIRARSLQLNQTTAQYAASTLEAQLESYFQAARREAEHPQLQAALATLLADAQLTELRGRIAQGEAGQVREQLLDNPVQDELDRVLQQQLDYYIDDDSAAAHEPRLATLYVTDAMGTILGIAYRDPVDRAQSSAGRNFAYRSYFHGGREDLPPTTPAGTVEPLTRTHLSAPFNSRATYLWKVAVSTPIYLGDDPDAPPDGVLVATTNLGEFQLMQSDSDPNQLAALVDARAGDYFGTILQHPLMDQRLKAGRTLATDRLAVPPPTLTALLDRRDVDYLDPVARIPDGQAYRGVWIAAVEPVSLPRNSRSAPVEKANLLVLVQYRLDEVTGPVNRVLESLIREGVAGVTSFILVTSVLWFFVLRASDRQADRDEAREQRAHSAETATVAR